MKKEKPKHDPEDLLLEYATRIIRLVESLLQESDELVRIFVPSIRTSTANSAEKSNTSPR